MNIVPVDWADVLEAQLLPEGAWNESAGDNVFQGFRPGQDDVAHGGNRLEDIFDLMLQVVVWTRTADPVQVPRQGPDVRRYGHLIIVQQDDHPLLEMPDLVYSFKRHAGSQPGVADERNYVEIFALQVPGSRDAQRRRNRGSGVGGIKHVVFRFFSSQEAADSIVLPYSRKLVATASDDLVRISLVTNVKNQLVPRRIERIVKSQYQLDRPETGASVTADFG